MGENRQDADFTIPLRFRLTGSPNGKPDLQLQILRLDFGSEVRNGSGKSSQDRRGLLTVPTATGKVSSALTCHM